MNTSHSTVEPIVNRNFGNTFHHKNVPNQRQHTNKNSSKKYHHITPRQQYQHINTGQQHQHRHPSQQFQPRSFQRYRTYSIPDLKENGLGSGLNKKSVREMIMQHYGVLEFPPFRGPLYMHEKSPREQLLQNNHKHGSRPKEFYDLI